MRTERCALKQLARQELRTRALLNEARLRSLLVAREFFVRERGIEKDIRGQTAEVLAAIDKLLQEAGTDKSRILMAQIFLADLADFEGMNAVWDAWVAPGNTPPRATVQAKLARPAWRIEVVVTAALP